jgi:hypothetical protein
LKPEYDKPLSSFGFNFNLRRYILGLLLLFVMCTAALCSLISLAAPSPAVANLTVSPRDYSCQHLKFQTGG